MRTNVFYNQECLAGMAKLPAASIDLILCDLPYGTTDNKWDVIIPFAPLWEEYKRVAKPNAAILLTGQGLFTHELIASNRAMYRYTLIWEKTMAAGFVNAKRMPLRAHEDIAVFYRKLPTYHPQMTSGKPYRTKADGSVCSNYSFKRSCPTINTGTRYPRSVLKFANSNYGSLHPTQKPVALFEYLIRTYSNPGDVVLDNCAGSGTTAIAALNAGRRYLCFERDQTYYEKAQARIATHGSGAVAIAA